MTVVRLASGREVELEVATDREGPASFLLSIYKCGSTMVNNMAKALARANERPFVDVDPTFFRAQVPAKEYRRDPALRQMLFPGNLYGGFRHMPDTLVESPLFVEGPKVLMVRDPRDALVSLYFSNARTHPIPTPLPGAREVTDQMQRQREEALASDIDTYVLDRAGGMRAAMLAYAPIRDWPTLTVVKYEDYVFRKDELLDLLADRFRLRAPEQLKEKILAWADVRPAVEDQTAFVRKVTPGDHREKLRPETIAQLNEIVRPALELFGYDAGT
jgi:hypothetical protein